MAAARFSPAASEQWNIHNTKTYDYNITKTDSLSLQTSDRRGTSVQIGSTPSSDPCRTLCRIIFCSDPLQRYKR